MIKAIGSKKDLRNEVYYTYIEDIIDTEEFQNLKKYTHHMCTTRFQHSLNVSYYNYKVCHWFGLNEKAGARAGLLHDLYFYSTNNRPSKEHLKNHPKIALQNASQVFNLTPLEMDIIEKHMFPITKKFPKYKETVVIILVDKYCALAEHIFHRLGRISSVMNHKKISVIE